MVDWNVVSFGLVGFFTLAQECAVVLRTDSLFMQKINVHNTFSILHFLAFSITKDGCKNLTSN